MIITQTKKCDICKKEFDGRFKNLSELWTQYYAGDSIKLRILDGHRITIVSYDVCPTCVRLVNDYINKLLKIPDLPEHPFLGKQINLKYDQLEPIPLNGGTKNGQ